MRVPVCVLHCFPPYQPLSTLGEGLQAQSVASVDGGEKEVGGERVQSSDNCEPSKKLTMITFTGEPGCSGVRDPAGSWDFLAYGYTIIHRFSLLCSPGATGLSFASVCWVGSTSFLEAWFSTKHLAHFPQSLPLRGEVMINQISMEIKILPSLTK